MKVSNNRQPTKYDVIVLALVPVIATICTLVLKTTFLWTTLLFFGIPSVYLSIRRPEFIKKILVFCLFLIVPFGIVLDVIIEVNRVWHVPFSHFDFRLFGFIPMEDILWAFLLPYFILFYYKHFLDHPPAFFESLRRFFHKKDEDKELLRKILIGDALVLLATSVVWLIFKFRIPYFYLFGGIIVVIAPLLVFVRERPNFVRRFLLLTLYLFPQFLLFEVAGLRMNQWEFPTGEFIGWVEILGQRFPFEEFVIWFIFIASTIAVIYEVVADDEK